MKTWRIILSIYITMLAIVPCCVFDGDQDHAEATEQSSHNEEEEHDCATACSPFFNCSSCNVSFIASDLSFDFFLPASVNCICVQYNPAIPQSITGKIWQPPKIS